MYRRCRPSRMKHEEFNLWCDIVSTYQIDVKQLSSAEHNLDALMLHHYVVMLRIIP
jgi:hypothetical protein